MSHLIKSWNNRAIRIREDRYVSLTDMAQATGKEVKHWNENKGTWSYLQALSSKVGIPTSKLIEIIRGGSAHEQGTWGHPKVALRFAQWCSDDFAVQVDCWIDELLTTGNVSLQQLQPQPQLAFDTQVRLEVELIQNVLTASGIDVKLVAGVALNHAGYRLPEMRQVVNEAHSLLAASAPSELLMTPTAIGQELGISARQVNLLLLDIGYQVKNLNRAKDAPAYLPTEIGQPYAANTLATGRLYELGADNTTYQHLKWKSQVVQVLREQMVEV